MFTLIKSFFNKLQMPEYAVEEAAEEDKAEKRDYEERQYKPSVWASTSVDLISADRPTMKNDNTRGLFFKLFNYIQGKNDKEQKMEMTVPVTREYIPGQGPACETKCTMSFYVPREFAENPPTPTEPDVFITNQPAMTVFVRTFGGYANDEKCMEEMIKFLPILEADGHSIRDDVYYFAGYDSPWKFLNRKNEVWVLKKEDPAGKSTEETTTTPATTPSTEAGKSD